MNLPTHIQARIEKEAEAHVGQYDYDLADDNEQADYVCCKEDYKAGAEGLFEILSAQKPELSREEIEWFSAELRERYNLGFDEETNAVNLGLWVLRQCHQQSAAVIGALRAQLNQAGADWIEETERLRKELDAALAEVERLRGNVDEVAQEKLSYGELVAVNKQFRAERDRLRAECERLKKYIDEIKDENEWSDDK